MKTIKTIILIGLIAFILPFTSCVDFLTPYNPQGLTEEMLYKTESGFESGINGAYVYIRDIWGNKRSAYMMEGGTDLWIAGENPAGDGMALLNYNGLDGTNIYNGTHFWRPMYFAINQCNTMLKYTNYALPNLSVTREAEMRVLRSFFWWVLTENYGNIHLTTEPHSGDMKGIKASPEEVYNQIVKDLEFAASGNNLPNTSADLGRITKPVAEALLARMCLFSGRNDEAITYAKNVINNYGYELETLDRLWDVKNQRENKEVIWFVPNNVLNGIEVANALYAPPYYSFSRTGTQWRCGFISSPLNETDGIFSNGRGQLMPSYRLLSLFDQNNDGRFNATFKSAWIANGNSGTLVGRQVYPTWTAQEAAEYNEYNNTTIAVSGQLRFVQGEISLQLLFNNPAAKRFPQVAYNTLDETDLYDATTQVPQEKNIYFQLKKHFDPTVESITITNRDFFLIRLAEMYLIIAEADFKLNGSNAPEGLKYLNELRKKRATPTAEASFSNVTSIPNIDFILDERARELCGEQFRWMDLRRTGKLLEYVRAYNPDAAPYIKEHHILRPYPILQLNTMSNPEDFKQEGY